MKELLKAEEVIEVVDHLTETGAVLDYATLVGHLAPGVAASAPLAGNNARARATALIHWLAGLPMRSDGSLPLATLLYGAAALVKATHPNVSRRLSARGSEVAARVDQRYSAPPTGSLPESAEAIFGPNDFIDPTFFEAATKASLRVVRIMVPVFKEGKQLYDDKGDAVIFRGTGWVCGTGGLLMTNAHVVRGRLGKAAELSDADRELQVSGTIVEFDHVKGKQATSAKLDRIVQMDVGLDYALLQLGGEYPNRTPMTVQLRPIELDLGGHGPGNSAYKPVNIIQHPGGETQQAAIRNNLVTRSDKETLRYFTNTEKGSSGSPVCNDQWHVVALHRSSGPLGEVLNFQGRNYASSNIGTQLAAIQKHLVKTGHWETLSARFDIAT